MTKQENCPDCGVGTGKPHRNECDVERCSICGHQRITCGCERHDPGKSVWTGEWPTNRKVPPFMAEAIHEVSHMIQTRINIPPTIELELEDDNALVWKTDGLVEEASKCLLQLSRSECETFGLPLGSTYADTAEIIKSKVGGKDSAAVE